jgi:hypothetical protein
MSLLWLVLGAFIGWSFPQPLWARVIQAKAIEMFKGLFSKPE